MRNRYFIATAVVVVYILVLHDTDIYTLWKRQEKVAALEAEIERKKTNIEEVRASLASLQDLRSLEKYARETHLFKKEDEDIFIFSFE